MSDDVANKASNEVVGVLSPTAAVPETVSIVKVNPAPPVAVAPNHTLLRFRRRFLAVQSHA